MILHVFECVPVCLRVSACVSCVGTPAALPFLTLDYAVRAAANVSSMVEVTLAPGAYNLTRELDLAAINVASLRLAGDEVRGSL